MAPRRDLEPEAAQQERMTSKFKAVHPAPTSGESPACECRCVAEAVRS